MVAAIAAAVVTVVLVPDVHVVRAAHGRGNPRLLSGADPARSCAGTRLRDVLRPRRPVSDSRRVRAVRPPSLGRATGGAARADRHRPGALRHRAAVGPRIAAWAAIAAGVIMFPLGLAAYSLLLALGFVLAGLASAVAGAMLDLAPSRRTAAFVLAGICAGTALFRPDLGRWSSHWSGRSRPAQVEAVRGRLRFRRDTAHRLPGVRGTQPSRSPRAGSLWASRPGRRLPPPSLSVSERELLWAATAATLLFLVVGATRVWRTREDARSRLLLAIGVLLVTLYPVIVNRADTAHILPVAAVAMAVPGPRAHARPGTRPGKCLWGSNSSR